MNRPPYIKVLCFYRYWAREAGITKEFSDGIMVTVANLRDVYAAFMRKMGNNVDRWGCYWVGPRPNAYELCGYIAENGIISKNPAKPNQPKRRERED